MGSTIAGQALFDSGPQRFVTKPLGKLFLPPLTLDALQSTTVVIANLETWVVQTGRLVGTDDDDLWDQVELIQLRAEAQLTGTLVIPSGREWASMSLLRFKPEGPVEHGRTVSLAYRTDYIRLS